MQNNSMCLAYNLCLRPRSTDQWDVLVVVIVGALLAGLGQVQTLCLDALEQSQGTSALRQLLGFASSCKNKAKEKLIS